MARRLRTLDRRLRRLSASLWGRGHGPSAGCELLATCPRATSICARSLPALREVEPGHWVACHHPGASHPS